MVKWPPQGQSWTSFNRTMWSSQVRNTTRYAPLISNTVNNHQRHRLHYALQAPVHSVSVTARIARFTRIRLQLKPNLQCLKARDSTFTTSENGVSLYMFWRRRWWMGADLGETKQLNFFLLGHQKVNEWQKTLTGSQDYYAITRQYLLFFHDFFFIGACSHVKGTH